MATRRTASLRIFPKVAEKNGNQHRGQLVAAGSGSWQMLSVAPRRPGQGEDAWWGCLCLTWHLAALSEDPKVTMPAPDGQPGCMRENFPFSKGDFPSWTRCWFQISSAECESVNYMWPGRFLQPSLSSKNTLIFQEERKKKPFLHCWR